MRSSGNHQPVDLKVCDKNSRLKIIMNNNTLFIKVVIKPSLIWTGTEIYNNLKQQKTIKRNSSSLEDDIRQDYIRYTFWSWF